MDYLDFELSIERGEGDLYPVRVLRSPAGEARATMAFPLTGLELQNQLQALQIALLKSGSTRRDIVAPQELESVKDFGRTLFKSLLPDEIRGSYRLSRSQAKMEGKGLRLRLRIEAPDLAALPWEFLYDDSEGDFVCLSSETPLVRYLELDRPTEPLSIQPPLRILGMVASPGDRATLDVAHERERMDEALADLAEDGTVSLTWLEGQTWRHLQRAMRKGPWHVFHFVGHGGFDAAAGEGLLAFANDAGGSALMPATQVGRLLADHASLRLAVLNACEGAQASTTDLFSSTSAVLVRRGIPAVVAMQYEITDGAAIEFSREFYAALAEGLPVDTAVAEARKSVSFKTANTFEWGTPVLHMRSPDGRLFAVDPVVAPAPGAPLARGVALAADPVPTAADAPAGEPASAGEAHAAPEAGAPTTEGAAAMGAGLVAGAAFADAARETAEAPEVDAPAAADTAPTVPSSLAAGPTLAPPPSAEGEAGASTGTPSAPGDGPSAGRALAAEHTPAPDSDPSQAAHAALAAGAGLAAGGALAAGASLAGATRVGDAVPEAPAADAAPSAPPSEAGTGSEVGASSVGSSAGTAPPIASATGEVEAGPRGTTASTRPEAAAASGAGRWKTLAAIAGLAAIIGFAVMTLGPWSVDPLVLPPVATNGGPGLPPGPPPTGTIPVGPDPIVDDSTATDPGPALAEGEATGADPDVATPPVEPPAFPEPWMAALNAEMLRLDQRRRDLVRTGDTAKGAIMTENWPAGHPGREDFERRVEAAEALLQPADRAAPQLPPDLTTQGARSVREEWEAVRREIEARRLRADQRQRALLQIRDDLRRQRNPPPSPPLVPPSLSGCGAAPPAVHVGSAVAISAGVERGESVHVAFGDGITASALPVRHTYTEAGTYTVTVTASNAAGSDTCRVPVTVVPAGQRLPVLTGCRATPSQVSPGQPVLFEAEVAGDPAVQIDFGDGQRASRLPARYAYSEAGVYHVVIRAGSDTCTAQVAVADAYCGDITELNVARFPYGDAVLTADARGRLDENIDLLQRCSAVDVRINGYSDGEEPGGAISLSRARAEAVAAYYVAQGIDAARLVLDASGVAPDASSKEDPGPGDSRARRVESIPMDGW